MSSGKQNRPPLGVSKQRPCTNMGRTVSMRLSLVHRLAGLGRPGRHRQGAHGQRPAQFHRGGLGPAGQKTPEKPTRRGAGVDGLGKADKVSATGLQALRERQAFALFAGMARELGENEAPHRAPAHSGQHAACFAATANAFCWPLLLLAPFAGERLQMRHRHHLPELGLRIRAGTALMHRQRRPFTRLPVETRKQMPTRLCAMARFLTPLR